MTEEQRMEEGRRMFQIFAARMFEQRVLTAYREKVAQERQKKLLEELEEETRLDVQREQKRAKEAQKKKDKKKQQKMAKDEERARKEAEKAAEEAAARAAEEKRAEEQRLKREEQRKKKEAERKQQEEERLRKEADKLRKMQEEREKQAEQERKHREQKEREKKRKEETKRKEREEREAKEKELKEKREREEKEKREREAKVKAEQAVKERARKEEQVAQQQAAAAQAAQAAQVAAQLSNKRSAQQIPTLPLPPGLPVQANSKTIKSPHLQIATPAVPKPPMGPRTRQPSQQGSVASSPNTPQVITRKGQSTSPSNASQHSSPGPVGGPRKPSGSQTYFPLVQPSTTVHTSMAPPPGMPFSSQAGVSGLPPLTSAHDLPTNPAPLHPFLAPRGSMAHDVLGQAQQPSAMPTPFRSFIPGGGIGMQHAPGAGRPLPAGRGHFGEVAPGFGHHGHQQQQAPIGTQHGHGFGGVTREPIGPPPHSRHHSQDIPNLDHSDGSSQPFGHSKPAPIQRPSSVSRQGQGTDSKADADIDELSNHLGSSALIDGNDESFPSDVTLPRRGSAAPLPNPVQRPARSQYGFGPVFRPGANRTLFLLLSSLLSI